ncbi:MAG: YajQ family cyclic di-GMP-binding protein [Isosphaeraceae bacterium]|nr:YajQ family cyclic di-GMP-binding protein [Isosphaeraceae bacterium]
MADNHTFDIVSEIDFVEMHNAVTQAQHEIAVRYDFKGTKASLEYDKKNNVITILADHKGQLDTVIQILKEKMAKRGVAVNAIKRGKIEEASHDSVREKLTLHVGVEMEDAKKLVKQIKSMGLKVQAQIMDQKVRVIGKKIDELQAVIAQLKENGPEYPLQFTNFS